MASDEDKSLVVGMQRNRQYVVDMLRGWGFTELADKASRELPDPVDSDRLEAWAMQQGISHDDLVSWFGGSP
jgi:hypothetical protein